MTLEQLIVIIKAETAGLEKGIDRVKGQLSSLEKAADRVSGSITNAFSKASSGMGKAFKALSLGAVIAGLTAFGKKALESASDLQEWQNVVDVAFGSASKQADTFAKMAVNKFGLSEVAAKKLTGTFMAMANGIGLSQAAGAKMSIQMSGLAADMASFFNTDYQTTMNALEGIFTGQTRALKQFGIVMTEANLEAFRMSRGLTTAYSDMNEAQRAALRYNYVLAQTANSQNDFARTSMSWANQMRQLAMNWQSLTSTIGSQLIGILTPVVAILNKILKAAIAVVNAIAKIFGGKGISGVSSSIGDAGDGAGALADNIGDVGDGLGKANKAAKKFKATIAGFDELEVLNPQPSSGGGGGGGSGGGGGGSPGADDLDSYFELYDEEGILNNFEDFFQKIKDMMDADNWEGIGAEVGKGLNNIFKVIDDWITNTFEPFGILWANRIARVLNGLVDTVDWDLIGKTFADGLNAYIHIANEFYETFNALNFAVGIASAINSWFRNVDWEGIGTYLANRLNFLGDILYGFSITIDWEQIKNSVQTALNTLFDKLDVDKIKTSIGKLVGDAVDFLKSINWYEIGYTVGEMLSGVDWMSVLITVKNQVIWPAFKGFWDGLMADGNNWLLSKIGKIGSWFEHNFFGPIAGLIIKILMGNVVLGALRGFFKGDFSKSLWGAFADSFAWVFGSIGGLVPSWGKTLGKAFSTVKGVIKDNLDIIGKGIKSNGLFDTLGTVFTTIGDQLGAQGITFGSIAGPIAGIAAAIAALSSAYGGLGGVLERVKKVFKDAWDVMKGVMDKLGATAAIEAAKEGFSKLGDAFKKVYDSLSVLKPLWEIVFNVISTALGVVGGLIGTVVSGIIGFVGAMADAAATFIDTFWTPISKVLEWVGNLCQGIIDFFANLKYQLIGDPIIIDMWEGIKKIFKDAIDKVKNFVKDLVDKVVKFFTDLKNKATEIFNAIKNFLTTTWNNIKTTTTNLWNSIKEWLNQTWEAIKTKATEVWNAILTITSTIWTTIKDTLTTIWETIKTAVYTAVENVKTTVSNAWNSIKETSSAVWEGIKTSLGSAWDGIKSKAESITTSIKNFFTTAYDSIKNKWDAFGGWFKGIFSGLDGTVKSAMNGVIGMMNRISVTVPNWVPKIGGKTFGFSIPYLAKGGIIDSPTVAMMGEYAGARSNPEIVAPQALLQSIIKEENGEMVSALYQIAKQIISAIDDVDLSVSIGDDQIGNAAARANNSYKKRTGKALFSM